MRHYQQHPQHSESQQPQRSADDQPTPGASPAPTADAQHQPNDLDDTINQATTLPDVLDIIQQHGSAFTDCNCVTAATRLAELYQPGHDDSTEHLEHPQFVALVDMVMAAAATFNPREITQLVGAFGQLQCQDQDLLDSLARELIGRIETMEVAALQELVRGLAKADHSPSVALFDAVRQRAKELGAEKNEQLAKGFAALDYTL